MPGYDPNFLQEDISLPLPSFSPVLAGDVLVNSRLTDGFLADYVNYSIITRISHKPISNQLGIRCCLFFKRSPKMTHCCF
ncbi:MAG: hypothetical protein WBM32_07755 [Crocosphaera sp.]